MDCFDAENVSSLRGNWAVEWGGHFATVTSRIKSPSVTLALLPPLQMWGPTTGGREGAHRRVFVVQ